MSEHPTRPTAVTPGASHDGRTDVAPEGGRAQPQRGPDHGRGAEPLETGTVISGRYRLEAPIATGGMATVWRAVDQILTRPVAVKILHARLAADPEFVARFRREAVAAARLAHPSIVAIYDTCSDPEAIVMELVEGRTLRAELDARGFLPPAEAVAIASGIAQALEIAHKSGLVHRDVKPANVLLSDDGRLKVADFGIAKAARSGGAEDDPDLPDLTAIGHMVGTAKYLAPEQVSGGEIDPRTDVYALGTVLYEMLCGRPPFSGENDLATATARLHALPQRPRAVLRTIPTRLDEIVMRALATDPADRYDSASALWAELQSAAVDAELSGSVGNGDDRPVDATAVTVAPSFAKAERSWLVPTLLVGLVAFALGLAWLLIGGTQARQGFSDLFDRVSPGGGGGSAQVEEVDLVAASAFDPLGDGGENDEDAGLATDGNPTTLWRTERYDLPGFAELKDGVGIYVDTGAPRALEELAVRARSDGWSAQVYVSDAPGAALGDWGEPVANLAGSAGEAVADLDGVRGRYVLLWLTEPGTAPDGRFRFELAELSLTAS